MKPEHFLVIGNGPAGFNAALTLRKKAPKSQITILSKEIESHYSPHLLPGFISGKIEENAIYPFPFSIYRENKIKLRNRQEAIALNISRRELTLAHNETISFDGLIIAAGGKPRIIEPLLRFKNFMLTLKTVQNAKHWVQTLKEVDSVFITGGDLTSLAFSKALVEMNKKVFFLLNKEALWPLRHTPTLFYEIKEALTQRGVHVIDGPGVTTISKVSKNVFGITTGNTTVKAGTVGAFFGLTPDIRFLAESGLNIDRGILTDQFLSTGFDGIYAAGDCAQVYHPGIKDYWVSIGYANAIDFGNTAASNLLGEKIKTTVAKESIFSIEGVQVNTSWWQNF